MFSFFKKRKNNEILKSHLSGFQGQFTNEQKRAIMVSLYVIANSDEEFHTKEVEFLQQTAYILGYQISNDIDQEFSGINRGKVFEQLKEFSDKQKEWYLITVTGMIHSDGKVLESELDDALRHLLSMGISKEKMIKSIKKFKAMSWSSV